LRQHSDDRHLVAAKQHGLADCILAAAKAAVPERVGQHYDVRRRASFALLLNEQPAGSRPSSERGEITAGGEADTQGLRILPMSGYEAAKGVGGYVGKAGNLVLYMLEGRITEKLDVVYCRLVLLLLPHEPDMLGMLHPFRWSQKESIHNAEHRGIGANGYRECEHHAQGKHRCPGKAPKESVGLGCESLPAVGAPDAYVAFRVFVHEFRSPAFQAAKALRCESLCFVW